MIYLTITKPDIESLENKSLSIPVSIIRFIGEKVKEYGKKPYTYYTYEITIEKLSRVSGDVWDGVTCHYDANIELHERLKGFTNNQKAIINVKMLKSNGKWIMYYGSSFLIGDTQPVPTPVTQPVPTPVTQPVPTPVTQPVPTPVAKPATKTILIQWQNTICELHAEFSKKLYDQQTITCNKDARKEFIKQLCDDIKDRSLDSLDLYTNDLQIKIPEQLKWYQDVFNSINHA